MINILKNDEKIIFQLRELYQKYGYFQYRMSKFEDYDFYVKNKDFLVSKNIITFTDTNGKLMALKPDVTLSIIRNIKETNDDIQKLYYNENVYRVSKSSNSFKELMQIGLECIGNIDDYCIFETIILAIKSLQVISNDYVLAISNLDIIFDILSELNLSKDDYKQLTKYIQDKNFHELSRLCDDMNIDTKIHEKLKAIVLIHDTPDISIAKLRQLNVNSIYIKQLENIISAIKIHNINSMIKIDLSLINDINYYNGIVFRGFINGVPNTILSGGQYDNLMKKMNKNSKAIGFAIYLDSLDRFLDDNSHFNNVDKLILYDDSSDVFVLLNLINELSRNNVDFLVDRKIPEKLEYDEIIKIVKDEVIKIEKDA